MDYLLVSRSLLWLALLWLSIYRSTSLVSSNSATIMIFLSLFCPTTYPAEMLTGSLWQHLLSLYIVPLSLFELKEQLIVQVTLGIMRFVTIGGVIVFSLANYLATDEKRCLMTCDNMWSEMKNDEELCNVTSTKEMATKFDGGSFLVAIPVFVFAHVSHQCIPGLTHPVKQKRYLRAY